LTSLIRLNDRRADGTNVNQSCIHDS